MIIRNIIKSNILYTNVCDAISTYKNEHKGYLPRYLVMNTQTFDLLIRCCNIDKVTDLEKRAIEGKSYYTFLQVPLAISDSLCYGELEAV